MVFKEKGEVGKRGKRKGEKGGDNMYIKKNGFSRCRLYRHNAAIC